MKKLTGLAVILLLVFSLVACSSSEKTEPEADAVTGEPAAAVDSDKEKAPEATEAPTAAPTAEPTAEPTPEPTAEPTEEPVPTEGPVVTEGPAEPDMTIAQAYYQYLSDYVSGSSVNPDDIHIELGFIDEDDNAELLITDGDTVGDMVTVVTFRDGKASKVGEYGANGSFTYLAYQNRIYSSVMGAGYTYMSVDHIENGTGVFDIGFSYMFDDDSYCVNDAPVSKEEYDRLYAQYYTSEIKPSTKRVTTLYDNGVSVNDYLGSEDADEYYFSMNSFYGYQTAYLTATEGEKEASGSTRGTWALKSLTYQKGDIAYSYTEGDYENSSCSASSELVVDDFVGVWFSIYNNEDWETIYGDDHYAMSKRFEEGALAEGLDFGWRYDTVSDYDDGIEISFSKSGNRIVLVQTIPVEGQAEADRIVAYYAKEFDPETYSSMVVEMSYNPSKDTETRYAFDVVEQVFIDEEDTELQAEYGYSDGLEGRLFAIEPKHGVDPYTIYIPKAGDVEVTLLRDNMVDYDTDVAELTSLLNGDTRIMYLYYLTYGYPLDEYDKSQLEPAAVIQPYLG